MNTLRPAIAGALLWVTAVAGAQSASARPGLSVTPAQPAPGGIVRLTLRAAGGDSVSAVQGTMAGEPLHFVRATGGEWHALGGIPVDAARRVTARVEFKHDGIAESLQLEVPVPPIPQ